MIGAATFAAWVQRFEGAIPTLYLDTRGLVTVGIGNLVDPLHLALALPFQHADGALASEEEIAADWARVKALPPGLVASRYATPAALRLSPAGIEAVVARQHDANVASLRRAFPDFDSYPEQAQLAILGMAWAMGSAFSVTFPRFANAVRARDWAQAAAECRIRNANADRNAAHRELLLAAAEGA